MELTSYHMLHVDPLVADGGISTATNWLLRIKLCKAMAIFVQDQQDATELARLRSRCAALEEAAAKQQVCL